MTKLCDYIRTATQRKCINQKLTVRKMHKLGDGSKQCRLYLYHCSDGGCRYSNSTASQQHTVDFSSCRLSLSVYSWCILPALCYCRVSLAFSLIPFFIILSISAWPENHRCNQVASEACICEYCACDSVLFWHVFHPALVGGINPPIPWHTTMSAYLYVCCTAIDMSKPSKNPFVANI